MGFQQGQQLVDLGLLRRRPAREQLDDPAFVRGGHALELAAALGRELHDEAAPVVGAGGAHHQALGLELVGDAGHVAAGHHQPLRQLAHRQAVGVALQLGQQVEARQRGAELGAQALADLVFHPRGAGQQPQPQPQRLVVVGRGAGFEVQGLGRHHMVSPPSTAMAWPLTPGLWTSQATVAATSAGWISRPCGLALASSASAC
mmetsp:Transcript_23400/g.55755  ORF Transcript_23400/g.55755 Transcript_23400/m.55755 type:complete len:203 (+) Transcript_23400:179-787(+)